MLETRLNVSLVYNAPNEYIECDFRSSRGGQIWMARTIGLSFGERFDDKALLFFPRARLRHGATVLLWSDSSISTECEVFRIDSGTLF